MVSGTANGAPRTTRVRWRPSYRIVSSRFPPAGLFDKVADPADLDAIWALDGLTNPRIRQQLGQLDRVPAGRRISGPGTTPVMAAFTHVPPDGSRFGDGSYGIYYAARDRATAISETVFHRERFLAQASHPATDLGMRLYLADVDARLHTLRPGWPEAHDPDSYAYSQRLGRRLREEGSDGLVFNSVRQAGGECVALFYPDLVSNCRQSEHFIYRWNGTRISDVIVASEILSR
jgi:hypothetical protein